MCLTLLCGCANQGSAEVSTTPTAELSKEERRNSIPVFYENPDEIYNYKFLTETGVKKTGITIREEPNSNVRAEARAYQWEKSRFNQQMKKFDEINMLFVRITFIDEPDLPKLSNGGQTKIVVDAIIGEGELLEKWKSLVKEAEFKFNRDCWFDSGEDYTEKETYISFYSAVHSSPQYLFDDDGRVYYNKMESVSFFQFPDNESGNGYIKLMEEIKTLAKERYNAAYHRASVYPYLTD